MPFFIFYSKGRESEIFHPLVHSKMPPTDHVWAIRKLGAKNSIWVSHPGCKASTHLLPSRMAIHKKLDWMQSNKGLNLTLQYGTWASQVVTHIIVPNAHSVRHYFSAMMKSKKLQFETNVRSSTPTHLTSL